MMRVRSSQHSAGRARSSSALQPSQPWALRQRLAVAALSSSGEGSGQQSDLPAGVMAMTRAT
eukprot:13925629-Alexandrium_andersonii.AAC.1